MAFTMNAFRHVMHGAQGWINHFSEARLLKGSRAPHTTGISEVNIEIITPSTCLSYSSAL